MKKLLKKLLHTTQMTGLPFLKPRFIAGITFVIGLVLLTSALLEISATRKELQAGLHQQALAVMALSQKGLDNAALSLSYVEELLAEKLLDNARLLEKLDYLGRLDKQMLQEIVAENQLFRVNVFDADGKRVLSNMAGEIGQIQAPRIFLKPVLQDSVDELILGFHQRPFGMSERFAVAKHRRRGGAIVVNVDAAQMTEFRRAIGAGSFIKLIGQSPEVRYAVLQDSNTIMLASQGVTLMSAPDSDPFLSEAFNSYEPLTRFTQFGDEDVFEIVQAAKVLPAKVAILRIGLSTAALHKAHHRAQLRLALASLLLLAVGVFAALVFIGAQNYRLLQQTLLRVETFSSSILKAMNEALIAVDRQGTVQFFNRAAEAMFGIKAEQVIAKRCETLTPICDWLHDALQHGRSRSNISQTLRIGEKDFFIQASVIIVRDENNNIDKVLVVIKDLTEEHRMQEHLKRQEQLSAMGHLASGVAHEIRNPLNAISMIAQRLHQEFTPTEEPSEYRRLTHTLFEETRRINDIIGQFLQFVRPQPLNKSKVQLQKIVNHVVELLQGEAKQKGIGLSVSCQDVPPIQADGDRLTQALLNLVKNSLAACKQNDLIEIICRQQKNQVVLEVRDTGSGISEENLPKIFNLYFTTRKDGSGLGLSIVQQIVSQHDGYITVHSEPGKETRFTIYLPIA